MFVVDTILYMALGFFALYVLFRPLETAFPAKDQPFFRPGWVTDLCFFLGQYLFWGSIVLAIMHACEQWLNQFVPPGLREKVSSQPLWLQIIGIVILSDLLVYWGHRLQHRFDFLWRFHSVHHSSTHLDWLAAHREHPVDSIYTIIMLNLPAFLLGVSIETLGYFLVFRALWSVYIHSNINLSLGWLRVLIGSPELHHWHHCRDRDAGNYANLSPLMDIIFGTYFYSQKKPDKLGINEPIPDNYLSQLWHPFRKRRQNPASHVCKKG